MHSQPPSASRSPVRNTKRSAQRLVMIHIRPTQRTFLCCYVTLHSLKYLLRGPYPKQPHTATQACPPPPVSSAQARQKGSDLSPWSLDQSLSPLHVHTAPLFLRPYLVWRLAVRCARGRQSSIGRSGPQCCQALSQLVPAGPDSTIHS